VKLLSSEVFFVAAGVGLIAVAVRLLRSTGAEGWTGAMFYGLLGLIFCLGRHLPPEWVGGMVVALVLVLARGRIKPPAPAAEEAEFRRASAARLGHRLLVPALLIPLVVLSAGWLLPRIRGDGWVMVAAKEANQVALGLGCLAGLVAAMKITRAGPRAAVDEGGRLLLTVGWALILPQVLAGLGGIFARAGIGELISQGMGAVLPMQWAWIAVVAYCGGMAMFTLVMGNAFAAFPVMTLGIGLPFIVRQHGGDPAVMSAFGMLSGYCGTLMTPMAANFNLVPALLLELEDRRAVIKAQVPFALALWSFNVLAMGLLVFRQ
jgi:uncharacterized membrane protein